MIPLTMTQLTGGRLRGYRSGDLTHQGSDFGAHPTLGIEQCSMPVQCLQGWYGHTKMDSTVRYLGVDLDDALSLSEGIDL